MVMDETKHVFPGGGVGEPLRVCQQETFAVCHLGCRPAHCLQLEVCRCFHWVLCMLDQVPVQGLRYCSSHGGFDVQGVSE